MVELTLVRSVQIDIDALLLKCERERGGWNVQLQKRTSTAPSNRAAGSLRRVLVEVDMSISSMLAYASKPRPR